MLMVFPMVITRRTRVTRQGQEERGESSALGYHPLTFQMRAMCPRFRDHALPIRREGGANDATLMPERFAQRLACGRIPQPGGVVRACGDDAPPIWREGGANGLVIMPERFAQRLAVAASQPGGVVVACGNDALPIWREAALLTT
jgi:hypothetical protein